MINILKTGKYNFVLVLIFLLFAIIYSLISIPNHYLYKTNAFDLGVFNNALHSFSRFQVNHTPLAIDGLPKNYFGNHFSPIIFLFVPFYYLFGSYTLLIIQIAAILFGGFGIYKVSELILKNRLYSILIVIQFFSVWAISSALSFDYHDNVLAAMLVPWLFYFHLSKRRNYFMLIFVLILLCRENMAFWMCFVLIGMCFLNNGEKPWRNFKQLLPYMLISGIYFILTLKVILPYFIEENWGDPLTRYSNMGDTIWEKLNFIFFKPQQLFKYLIENPTTEVFYNGLKSEFHFMILVSGGIFLFRFPKFLLMAVPLYFQKLLTNDFGFWGINAHYSIEFVPIISLALIYAALHFKRYAKYLLIFVCISTLGFHIKSLYERQSLHYNQEHNNFLIAEHYQANMNLSDVKKVINEIPKYVSVSASSELTPHLANRKNIYLFPIVKNAEYIVLLKKGTNYYPIGEKDFNLRVKELRSNSNYKITKENKSIVVFKRR